MSEPAPSPNPFLRDQTTPIPDVSAEEGAQSTPTPAPVEPSPNAASVIPPVSSVEDVIATPASKWRHRMVWRSVFVLLSVAVIAGILYWWFRDVGSAPVANETAQSVPETKPTLPSPNPEPDPESLALPDENANYASENFQAGEIVIGGELQFLVSEDEVGALTIENIRGEAFTEKNKKEVKLVVTWTTNKLSQAAVKYAKGIGQTERSIDEDDYSYNHSVIISGLDPASTYLYTIDASDRYGNRVKSEPHAVFTGARTVSLFDLIAGAIGEVFGWAVTSK